MENVFSDGKVIAAIISALVTLGIAIWTFITNNRNQKIIEEFKSKLLEEHSERSARRDYEYEAKKRLYKEFEPILFQFS